MLIVQVRWLEKVCGKWETHLTSLLAASIREAVEIVKYGADFQHHEIKIEGAV